jgi:glycosyltransferase involved in cell wall biosynthesis
MAYTSVIIPAHNEQEYIARTIQSYQQQQFKGAKLPYELIVVANGNDAKDDTPNIAHDLGARVIELSEGNVSKARNEGARNAQGDILVFNDADTLVAPNYLQEIVDAMAKGTDFGCAKITSESRNFWTKLYYGQLNLISRYMGYFHGNCFIERNIFEEVNGYNPILRTSEDTDISIRVRNLGQFNYLNKTAIITSDRIIKHAPFIKLVKLNINNFEWLFSPRSWEKKHFGEK